LKKLIYLFLSFLIVFSFVANANALTSLFNSTDYTVENYNNGAGLTNTNDLWNTDDWDNNKFGYEDTSNANYFSGYYIGTIAGNDGLQEKTDGDGNTYYVGFMDELIDYYLGNDYTINFWEKDENYSNGGDLNFSADNSRVYPDDDGSDKIIGGDWALTSGYTLEFYTVKAGSDFALYYLDPSQASGNWWTGHLRNGDKSIDSISHFSAFYNETSPVPEPTTMLLLGFGLVGIGVLSRKKLLK
jgi:hypothetical protein